MKGFLTLCSAVLALLKVVCIPAEAQDAEMTDTLARAVISSSRPAIASTGLKRFDGGELLGGAAILGSPDVLKFLQNLPGVVSGMELMSGLYVRGGDGSDNLFMLDGVPLFQVSHLAGIFSSFNTDVIESLDFYESGFPARYGGRLSSIVDIRTKNGSMEDFGGSVSVGLIDGRINLNGPIVRNKLSYDIAIRRSWLDALVAPVLAIENSGSKTKTNGGYALFDSNLNLTYTPGPRDMLNLRFYMGSDNFNYSNTTEEKYYGKEIYYSESGTSLKMKWGNLAASAGWKHLISRNSRINTLLYFSRAFSNIRDWQKTDDFSNEILTSTGYAGNTAGNVTAAGFRSIFLHSASHHNLSAGIEYRSSWFNPSRSEERNVDDRPASSVSSAEDYRSDEASVFVEGATRIENAAREPEIVDLAKDLGVSVEKLHTVIDSLHEFNPMMGHRGCRLAVSYPEIAEMQTTAVINAAINVSKETGVKIVPHIMIPLVGEVKELKFVKDVVVATADKIIAEAGVDMKYEVGTMIEIPRAALTADEIAKEAEFFSFGTNDLTQMTFGFSRDDAGKFLSYYYDNKVYESDPFAHLDQNGVGKLVEMAAKLGRQTRPELGLGICGEHGGDPTSVEFCHRVGLDYVSCSPFRVPIARLAAAQAAIKNPR